MYLLPWAGCEAPLSLRSEPTPDIKKIFLILICFKKKFSKASGAQGWEILTSWFAFAQNLIL